MGQVEDSLVSEATLPKVGCIGLRDAKLIAGENSVRKNCFQFTQHVGEDETKLGEVATVVRVLVEHLHLAFLEQLYGLLALSHQIIDEDVEVFVGVQDMHLILVLRVD